MNSCLVLLILCQTTIVYSKTSKHAATLARFLKSKEALFDNVTFPEDSQSGRGLEEDIEKLQGFFRDNNILEGVFGNFKKIFRKEVKEIKEYEDDNRRMMQFQNNLLSVLLHNFKAKKSYSKTINAFSDMDFEDMVRYYTGFIPAPANATVKTGRNIRRENPQPPPFPSRKEHHHGHKENIVIQNGRRIQTVPNSKDWRTFGVVSPVKNQYTCGSCTLFAAANALESSWHLWHGGEMLDLSEQQLLDCIPSGNGHFFCQGNFAESTYSYLQSHGIGIESSDPYLNEQGTCKNIPTVAQVKDFFRIPNDEDEIKKYLALFGPLSGAIHASEDIMSYSSGIFTEDCEGEMNHSILIVGYGTEKGKDYWIIKNSWGTTWGEEGYFRILRGKNMCGIANYVFMITS